MSHAEMRDAHQVIEDIAEALGCKPDNEAILERIDRMRSLLRTYREKTPLGHQPHMIAQEVDMVLANEQETPQKEKPRSHHAGWTYPEDRS